MSARDGATQRAEQPRRQHPLQQQIRAHIQPAAIEPPSETADDEDGQQQREPGKSLLLRRRLQHCHNAGGRCVVLAQMLRQALQVARADDGEHLRHDAFDPRVQRMHAGCVLAQARRHVPVALGDDGLVKLGAVAGELGKGRLEHVAFLELLDLLGAHVLVGEQAGQQSGRQLRTAPPAKTLRRAPERHADIAIDQLHRQAAFARIDDSCLQFRARIDSELRGETTLIGRERQIGREHRDAAIADHLAQVHLCECIRIGQCL